MLKLVSFVLSLSWVLLGVLCSKEPTPEEYVKFKNELDKPIYVVPSYNYPDTSLSFTSGKHMRDRPNDYLVSAGSVNSLNHDICYKEGYDYMVRNSDKFYVFVFDSAIVNNVPWKVIEEQYLVVDRIAVDFEYLQSNNCTIVIE